MNKISIAATTYNRFETTIKCIEKIKDDDRVSDILILDDCSTDGSYERLVDYYEGDRKAIVTGKQIGRAHV